MDTARFDRLSRLFAHRRLTRGEGLVAEAFAAQEATPDATPAPVFDPAQKIDFLFVQTFQSGSIAPVEGMEGRYTVTLEQGTGQTVYFSDRPERVVGANPTPQFLEGLGFLADNPPNAALVVETAPGETDVAVVELFNPLYDPVSHGVTYEVQVLESWEDSPGMGFHEAPTDLAALAPTFGSAHLFIDDCPNLDIWCALAYPTEVPDPPPDYPHGFAGTFSNQGMCWNYGLCIPCEPYGHVQPDRCSTQTHWDNACKQQFPRCSTAEGPCKAEWNWPGHRWLCW